mmetsp:Transcript_26722/g.43674  ORF Transcript_26722/g.43674 Transcript_26722/m.43674 type:complete len:428 (-) Transcript_26722:1154-2437(-)|eukprot:CAMPEP_0184660552 /NCGR_PEP_ID=MMETSP0308-20130426/34362_1 /TAXON_ID=38269 /ORGANISM="Gloeochaete witrockiana, Strain SAG 46.84" /LENGTH=427 /DNA_ID=CAMNT_0027101221 /DNA_START=123 /DNA_END=1406 /DNA_ORIENTATION=+
MRLRIITYGLVLFGLYLTTAISAPSPAIVSATLFPSSLVSSQGTTVGSVVSLAFKDQSGTQNATGKYVQFSTPVTYVGYRRYFVPASVPAANISSLKVKLNYRGPLPSVQLWTWSIFTWSSSSWSVIVGTNNGAVRGQWTSLSFNVPAPFSRFISSSGEVRLQLKSSNTLGSALLDFESLAMSYSAPLPSASGTYWKPALRSSWQIQYTGVFDFSLKVNIYNLDAFDTPKATIDALHSRGIKVMCYFSAGSWENWRSDKNSFPPYVLGNNLDGWPGEKWLDIRRLDVIGPIMTARIQLCKNKGFDGIDPDNVNGFSNPTGFPISFQDQLNYNIFLAHVAHKLGLAAGLKNDNAQAVILVNYFDWQLNEECFEFAECDSLEVFIDAGKPVFNIEYNLAPAAFCSQANALNFNSLRKNLELDSFRVACR